MLNSPIISGIAGNNIVSPYIVINIEEPRITKVLHAEVEILLLLFFYYLDCESRSFVLSKLV
jgi:hypothetical protein